MAELASFLDVPPGSDFPIQNLPWGVFSTRTDARRRIGVALGDHVIDVMELQRAGLLSGPQLTGSCDASNVFASGSLNSFLALGRASWQEARTCLQRLLSKQEGVLRDDAKLRSRAVVPQKEAVMHLPAQVGDYTDFYASVHHAFNVGALFRGPGQQLQPNWRHLPVGYHGRASSIVVSGERVRRPRGQIKPADATNPTFVPSKALDFELEMGALIGPGNTLGEPISLERAHDHVFGYVLLNDWSARDIQAWEYVPLGPFNSKNWVTQISPWVVTTDALEPFRTSAPLQEPAPLSYLQAPQGQLSTYAVNLTVDIIPSGQLHESRVTSTNLKHLYWTFEQMVTHHTAGGCNLRPGDLLGSGTLSGPETQSQACLLELTRAGRAPITLTDEAGKGGVQRTYLQDGDEVVMRGWCEDPASVPFRVGFGECRGAVLPCPAYSLAN